MKQSQIKIIKYGKILKNYLVDYPQHILNNPEADYQLIIGSNELTLEFDFSMLANSNAEFTVALPFIPNKLNNFMVDWGDDEEIEPIENTATIVKHTYNPRAKLNVDFTSVRISIFGTVFGFNNKDNIPTEAGVKNAWDYLTAILKWRKYYHLFFRIWIL